jgi:hypothetical protein
MGFGGQMESTWAWDASDGGTHWDDGMTSEDGYDVHGSSGLNDQTSIDDRIFPVQDEIVFRFINFSSDLRVTIDVIDHEQADWVFASCTIHKGASTLPYFVRFTGFPPSQDGSDTHLRDFHARFTTQNLNNARTLGDHAILSKHTS